MGLFRRRPVEATPVYIVPQKPRRPFPWLIVGGLAFLLILAALRAMPPGSPASSSAPGRTPAAVPVAPTAEAGLEAAIVAADARYDKRVQTNDAKCDAMTDVDAATACVERSTAIVEEQSRFDECATRILRVADVARCETEAAH